MAYDFQTGLAGAGAGAATGASIGGPWGAGAGALVGLASGFFGRPKRPNVNIDAELARLRALFQGQREAAKAGIDANLADLNSSTASRLAANGTLTSPVGEYAFGANSKAAQLALAHAYGAIGAQEGSSGSSLLQGLLGRQYQNEDAKYAEDSSTRNQIFSGLTAAAMAYLNSKKPGSVNLPSGYMNPSATPMTTGYNPSGYGQDFYRNQFPGLWRQ